MWWATVAGLIGLLLGPGAATLASSAASSHPLPAAQLFTGVGAVGGVQLHPCGGEANATGRQNWTIATDANGLIGLAGADLWLALLPSPTNGTDQPVVVLSRNRSAALKFEFLPAGRGQRGAEVWIRTAEPVSGAGELLCLDDYASAPHRPSRLPVGGVFLGGCDDMSGAETWVAAGAEHWSTRNKPKWLVCGSTDDEQCLTAVPTAAAGDDDTMPRSENA
jgi:hypothetical protein